MAVRPLVILPDPRIRLVSRPVEKVDDEIRSLVGDMFDTMYKNGGIGLGAIQIGAELRVATIDVSVYHNEEGKVDEPNKQNQLVLLNPEILWHSEEISEMEEGCLSIPGYKDDVQRPEKIRISYRDMDFKEQELEADGLLATCIQHEIDHINGICFIDHLSRLKRDRAIKKFTKLAKERKFSGETA